MRFLAAIALAAGVMFAAAPAHASDRVVELTYAALASAAQGEPSIALGDVTDGREHDRTWLGAIRGGFGNPLKVLHTQGPVSDAVGAAVRDGLAARNLGASDGARYRLNVHVVQFDCNQYVRREAHIELQLRLVDAATGAVVHELSADVDQVEGSVLSLATGIFASPEQLRALANAVLQSAVDQALDDADFRAALARPAETAPAMAAASEEVAAASTPVQ